jgi:hypothetical protein
MNHALGAFSTVMILCAMINLVSMALRIHPPPWKIWMGGWILAGVLAGILVYGS